MFKRLLFVQLLFCLTFFSYGQVREISIDQLVAETSTVDGPLIINFWATWCQPCVEEIPYFIEEAKANNITIWLVSLDLSDDKGKINQFAMQRGINAPLFWLNETNADYFCPKIDPAWSGALPASVFINKGKGIQLFAEGQLSREELKEKIRAIL